MKKMIYITGFTVLCFGVAAVSSLWLDKDKSYESFIQSENVYISKPAERRYKTNSFSSLNFKSQVADFEVVVSKDLSDEVVITYEESYKKENTKELYFPIIEESIKDNELQLAFKTADEDSKTNSNLSFKPSKKFPYFSVSISNPNSKFKLMIPEGFDLKALSLEIVTGDVQIPELNLNSLQLSLVTGDVSVQNLKAEKLDIELVTGDVHIDGGHSKSLQVQTVTGDIQLKNISVNSNYSLETVTGDIQIAAIDELKSELNINSTTGDIEIDGKNYDDSVHIVSKENSGVLNIDVTTGDVSLQTSNKL